MLEYCACPKCRRMIMLDSDQASGFCLYCGTHIAYSEGRDALLEGLKASIPDAAALIADMSELIGDDGLEDDTAGLEECREERARASEYMGKWDFSKAFESFTRAAEWYPADFESVCGIMTAGILRLKDVENWEKYLARCISLIRSQSDWNMAGKALEYALDIMRRFLSKGGRFVSPQYTVGFFEKLTESFPALRTNAAEIFAHCLNVDNAPFTDAARLDHETTRFAVGNYPNEPDKELRRGTLLAVKYLPDARVKDALCRALYVYDRSVWLRTRDETRINDAMTLCENATDGRLKPQDAKIVLQSAYDLLMMGGLEQNATPREKLKFLSRVYKIADMRRMERFFSGDLFFNRLYGEIYLSQKNANAFSPEYKRIQERIRKLSV